MAPHIAEWDRTHAFPRKLYTKLTEAGLMGIAVPEEFGGAGADYVSLALAIEEIAKVDAGSGVTLSVHAMICAAILTLGTDEQKQKYLPKLAGGDAIAAFALTEPEAGSDSAAIRATARRDGDAWVLNGRKQWCTNGGYSGVTMAMFRTGAEGSRGVSAFLIDSEAQGMTIENVTNKLGVHTSNTCDIAFEGVRVPSNALLAGEGEGIRSALRTLTSGRIGIAAQAVGILAACLEASVAFAKDRQAFGKPIAAFEGVSFKIARMATDLDAARLLTYRAAALRDAGKPFVQEASMAKLFASTKAREHAAEAVQ
ncbi:MAG: acyl-CoA dehydrogenase family protein, partial [Vulcanimicrobiaceae bacterium]